MPDETYGVPEITQADLKGRPFRLNAVLRFLAKRIETALGYAGPVRYGAGPFALNGPVSIAGGLTADTLALGKLSGLPVYADNAAAQAAGLRADQPYRTATGVVMVVYD